MAQLSAEARTHNLEAELLKMEKGALGKKWSRKLVVVDGENKTIRYHRPKDDKRSAPRKIFRLSELLLDANVQGPKRAPKAFELRHRVNGYSIVLACERGAAEHRAWCNVLAPLAHAAVSLPPAPGPPPSPRIADDDDEAEARDDSEALTLLAELFPQASSEVIQSEYSLADNDVDLAMQSLENRFNDNALPSGATADEDALATLVRLFPNMPENQVRAELEKVGGTLEAATEALLGRRSKAIRLQQQQQEQQSRFDATFEQGQPLGLQLRLTPANDAGVRHVVILAVKPTCPAAQTLREGDKLVASNGIDIPHARTKQQFGELTKSLARAPRPLVLTFERLAEAKNITAQPYQTDCDKSEDPVDNTISPGMIRRHPHDLKDERPTDPEMPARRSRRQHQRFEVSFDTFPLGFKLVLAQYPHGRLAIQLNDVSASCARFAQLQVLDELVSIAGSSDFAEPEVTPGSFELATQTLSAAVRSQLTPLRLGFARKPAVFSIDFPRKPLGLILRLTTIDDRKAVIVKDVQHSDSKAPASGLQAGDDQLIAVHGKLVPQHCDTSEFERLMLELKESTHWPLRLTFWRHSLGTEDEQIFSSSPTSEERTTDRPPSLGPSLPSLEDNSDDEVSPARASDAELAREIKLIEDTVDVAGQSEDVETEAEKAAAPVETEAEEAAAPVETEAEEAATLVETEAEEAAATVETAKPSLEAIREEDAKKAKEQNIMEATEPVVAMPAQDAEHLEKADTVEAVEPVVQNEAAEQSAVTTLTQDAPKQDIIEKLSAQAFVEAAYQPRSHNPHHVPNYDPEELPEEPHEPMISTTATANERDNLTTLSEPHFAEDKSVLASAAVVAMERIPALMTFTPSRQVRQGGPRISSDPQMLLKENDAKPTSTEAAEDPLIIEKEEAVPLDAGDPTNEVRQLVNGKHIEQANGATVMDGLKLPPEESKLHAGDPGRPNTAPARMTSKLAEFLETGRLPEAMPDSPLDETPLHASEQMPGSGEADFLPGAREPEVKTPSRDLIDGRITEDGVSSTCLARSAGSVTAEALPRKANRRTSKGSHVEAMKRQLEERIEAQHPAYKKPEVSSVTKNEAQELVESLVTGQDSFGVASTKQQLAQSAISRPSPTRAVSEEELPARGTTPRLSAIFGQTKMPARSVSASPVIEDDEESDFDGTHDSDSANDRGSAYLPNAASTTPSECSKYKVRAVTADLLVEATRQLDDDGHDDLVGIQRTDADRRHAMLLEEQLETLRKELERTSSELLQAKEALTRETALAEDRVGAAEAAAAALIELARLELGEAQREAKRRFDLLDEAIRRATPGYVPGDKADIAKLREELATARRDAEVARVELEAAKCRELEAIEIARRDVDSAKRQLRSKEGDVLPDDGELDETAERRENEELQDALRHLEQLDAAVPDDDDNEVSGVGGNGPWLKREDADTDAADTDAESFMLPLTHEHTAHDDYSGVVATLGTNAKREVHSVVAEQQSEDGQSSAADQKSKDGPSSVAEQQSQDRENVFIKADQHRDDNELDAEAPIEARASTDLEAPREETAHGDLPCEEDGIAHFVPDLQLDDDDDMDAALELEAASKREERTIAAELARDAAEEQAQDRELILIEAERHRQEAELEADLALEALAHEDREQMEAAAALEEARWDCALSPENEDVLTLQPDCTYSNEAHNVRRNGECREHHNESEAARNFYEQDDWLDEAKKQQQDHERDEMLHGAASFDASYHYDPARQPGGDIPVSRAPYCNSRSMHAAQYPAFDCSPAAEMRGTAHAESEFSTPLETEPTHAAMHPNTGYSDATGDEDTELGHEQLEGVDDFHDGDEEDESFGEDVAENGAVLMLHSHDEQRRDVELQWANETEELYTSEAEQPDSTSLLDKDLAEHAPSALEEQRCSSFTNDDDDLRHMSEETRQAIKVATREAFEEERRAAQVELAAARDRELQKIQCVSCHCFVCLLRIRGSAALNHLTRSLAKDELQRELEYVRHQAKVELDAELEHEKAAIEAARQRELESVRKARVEIEEATRREIAEIKERARRTLDEATRLELEEVRKAAEEVRELELARIQQARDDIQAAAREQLDQIEMTRERLRTPHTTGVNVTGVRRDEECDALAAAYFQRGLSGIELARSCLCSGLSPPPTCRELIKACLRQLAAVDRHTEVRWCERRHVGAALRALASVDDDALCVGDDGGWVAALDELVAYCDEVLDFGTASNATPHLVVYFATLLEQGVVPREAFESWRGRNAAALADTQHDNQRRRPAIALRQTDSWFASMTILCEERSASQSSAVTTRNRGVAPSRLSARDLASPTSLKRADDAGGMSKRFPPTAAEVEVALSLVARENGVGNTDPSQSALLQRIREEGPRGARVMAAALATIDDDDKAAFRELIGRTAHALRAMLKADISEQAALVAVVAEHAGAELSDRLEVLRDASVVDEAGLRAWHALCSVDAECARDSERQAEAHAALVGAETFFEKHNMASASADSAKLEERLAVERDRLDAELARRLVDERSFFEKRLEQFSPPRAPSCNADPDCDQTPSGIAVVRDLSSSFAAHANAKPLALQHGASLQDDTLLKEGLARAAMLEERIAQAEQRFAASQAKLLASSDTETLARLNAPSPSSTDKVTEITKKRSEDFDIPSSGRPPPLGLPQSVQPLLRERFLTLLCKPRGPLLDDEACPLRVSIEHSYSGAVGWCVVEIANASGNDVRALKVDVFSDDERFMANPLARRRRDVSSEQRPATRLSVAFNNEDRMPRGGGCVSLKPGAEITRRLAAECRAPFVVPPELTLRFEMSGKRYAYALRLPIAPPAFATPDEGCAVDLTLFRSRWDAMGSATEQQIVVSSKTPINDAVLDDLKYRVVCRACRAAIVKGADATKFTVTAATAVCCSSPSPRVIVLIRLEINVPAHAYRITVRSPSADASAAFKNVIQALITSYFIM